MPPSPSINDQKSVKHPFEKRTNNNPKLSSSQSPLQNLTNPNSPWRHPPPYYIFCLFLFVFVCLFISFVCSFISLKLELTLTTSSSLRTRWVWAAIAKSSQIFHFWFFISITKLSFIFLSLCHQTADPHPPRYFANGSQCSHYEQKLFALCFWSFPRASVTLSLKKKCSFVCLAIYQWGRLS